MSDTATYGAWVDSVHALGGVATAWPFQTGAYAGSYGLPAARFPADTFANLANVGALPMATGVQFNVPGTWVYVLASSMTGDTNIDNAAQGLIAPTQAELEQACAQEGNCPVDWTGLIKEIVVGIAILAGVAVFSKIG